MDEHNSLSVFKKQVIEKDSGVNVLQLTTPHVTSISENERNIRIPLRNGPSFECNVEHCFGNLSEKDALTEKKIQNAQTSQIYAPSERNVASPYLPKLFLRDSYEQSPLSV